MKKMKIFSLRKFLLQTVVNSLSLIIVLLACKYFNILGYGNRSHLSLIIESVIVGTVSSFFYFLFMKGDD